MAPYHHNILFYSNSRIACSAMILGHLGAMTLCTKISSYINFLSTQSLSLTHHSLTLSLSLSLSLTFGLPGKKGKKEERRRKRRKEKIRFLAANPFCYFTKFSQITIGDLYPISIFKDFAFDHLILSKLVLLYFF